MVKDVNVKLDGTNVSRINEREILTSGWLSKRNSSHSGSEKFRTFTSNLSQGCMIVVAVLPLAGLFLGIGSAISSHSPSLSVGYFVGECMSGLGNFVFTNLQILFAVAITIAFTNQAPVAAFGAVVATLVFNGVQSALIVESSYLPGDPVHTKYYDVLYWRHVSEHVFTNNVGIRSTSSSVFGGVIVATIVVVIYNKFHTIRLPEVINFFGGNRFVPIASSLAMLPTAILTCMVWPGIGIFLSLIGLWMGTLSANGNANAFLFGYIKRALVPFGIHHAFYAPLWLTSAGGDMTRSLGEIAYIQTEGMCAAVVGVENQISGEPMTWDQVFRALLGNGYSKNKLVGDQVLWMTINQMSTKKLILQNHLVPYTVTFKTFAHSTFHHPAAYYKSSSGAFVLAFPGVNPSQYEQGGYPCMLFGLPAASAAMILAAPKNQRKAAFSILGAAALTSFLTGVTEPIEFTFLFLSPALFWVVNAFFFGLSYWLVAFLGANVGVTFSAGVIDFIIFGLIPDLLGAKTNCWIIIVVGLGFIPLYFFTFYWWIKHFNLNTPGRGGAIKLFTKKDYLAKNDPSLLNNQTKVEKFTSNDVQAYYVCKAIGGVSNIENVNACASKLRISTKNKELICQDIVKLLMDIGARGVQKQGGYILAVFGFDSDLIASSMHKIINEEINLKQLADFVSENQTKPPASETNFASSPTQNLQRVLVVKSPLSGQVVSLADTNDVAFSSQLIGDGLAIIPDRGETCAPVSGYIKVAFRGGHAYVITCQEIDIMIHLGIDTVNINANKKAGEKLLAFTPFVQHNDQVKAGQVLTMVDLDYLKNHHYRAITPVIVLNESLKNYQVKLLVDLGSMVKIGTPIFEIVKKTSF